MDILFLIKAAVMGIVEGLTEFLPISSTGHLILAGALLNFQGEKSKVFEVVIQSAAIFAVVLVYWERLKQTVTELPKSPQAQRFSLNILIGFLPAVVLGLVFGKAVKEHLFTPLVVATSFIVGGLVILWAERSQRAGRARVQTVDELRWTDALKVGLVQCVAFIPGASRSGSVIIGGMFLGLSRQAATDFSFFLGIPTLMGAGAYALFKARDVLSVSDLPIFLVGGVFSFLSAWLCVRWLLRYVATHSFVPFAWYRIVFGGVVLLTHFMGWVVWLD